MSITATWFFISSVAAIREIRHNWPGGMHPEERRRRLCTAKNLTGYSLYKMYLQMHYEGYTGWEVATALGGSFLITGIVFAIVVILQQVWNRLVVDNGATDVHSIDFLFTWIAVLFFEFLAFTFYMICMCIYNWNRLRSRLNRNYDRFMSNSTPEDRRKLREDMEAGTIDMENFTVGHGDEPINEDLQREDEKKKEEERKKKQEQPPEPVSPAQEDYDEDEQLYMIAQNLSKEKVKPQNNQKKGKGSKK